MFAVPMSLTTMMRSSLLRKEHESFSSTHFDHHIVLSSSDDVLLDIVRLPLVLRQTATELDSSKRSSRAQHEHLTQDVVQGQGTSSHKVLFLRGVVVVGLRNLKKSCFHVESPMVDEVNYLGRNCPKKTIKFESFPRAT